MSNSDYTNGALPSGIESDAALAANEERYAQLRDQFSQPLPQPAFVPNTIVVDAVALAKAQGRFINEQTKFLLVTQDQDYQLALTAYSRAQTAYITALQQALRQADVI